jgi:hypothetical protein
MDTEEEVQVATRSDLFEFEVDSRLETPSQSRWATGYEHESMLVLQSVPLAVASVLGPVPLSTFSLSRSHVSLRNLLPQNHTLTPTHDQHMSLSLVPMSFLSRPLIASRSTPATFRVPH